MLYPLNNWLKLKRGYLFGEKTFYNNFHLGLDVIPDASSGNNLIAWQDLEVKECFFGKEGGNTIFIKCPNNHRLFRCMHLAQPGKNGIYKEGQTIGIIGNTGDKSRGIHLHIDISKNGALDLRNLQNFEDPEVYFKTINNNIDNNNINIDNNVNKTDITKGKHPNKTS